MTETKKTLLDYVPDLLADLERRQGDADAARAEAGRIAAKIIEIELAIDKRRSELVKPDRSTALAKAVLAGAPPPADPPPPPGPTIMDLEETIAGLRRLKLEAESRAKDIQGEVRAALGRLFPAAAERAAVDYVKHAQALAALHAAIGAAEEGAQSAPGREPWEGVMGGPDWGKLFIPASEQLEAFLPFINPMRNVQVIAGGSFDESAKASAQAFAAAQSEIRRRLGGRWPFDREF